MHGPPHPAPRAAVPEPLADQDGTDRPDRASLDCERPDRIDVADRFHDASSAGTASGDTMLITLVCAVLGWLLIHSSRTTLACCALFLLAIDCATVIVRALQ